MTPIPGVQLHRQAVEDLREIFLFLAQTNQERANLFARNVQSSIELLIHSPKLGSPRSYADSRLHSLRRWPLKDFKQYGIFYRPFASGNGIEVFRVLHSSRESQTHLQESLNS
ncbi:type II toxin-antitoxin system RelE/ParE family toxin [bacterium]|nr:MAG: type II toxin-antitoxin system RelE/ParE family toxin [bacterium]